MLDDKQLKELQSRMKHHLDDGVIRTKGTKEYVGFFLANAKKSLASAELLYAVSASKELQSATGFRNFDGYLWVINASYYSMFYMTRALLENEGIKLRSELSIHVLAFDALVHFFFLTGKLQKRLIEDLAEAKREAGELLSQEKAHELIEGYLFERKKRGIFTYDMGAVAIQTRAKTSLDRANKFIEEMKKIII